VVATANRGGRTLIAVVLGSLSGAERTVQAAQLLDAGFASWGGTGYSVASMPPSGTRAHGRGLHLVDAIAAAWGVQPRPGGGKVVWAELLRESGDPNDEFA
jgi:D-alanyl-D-alanine carboxypeptidase